jgi:hypothetical protein
MGFSDRPTDPNILPPTLTFFMPKKKKKSRPTDPNFEDHAIGNTHIYFLALFVFYDLKKFLSYVMDLWLAFKTIPTQSIES